MGFWIRSSFVALNINDPETERLAREFARLSGLDEIITRGRARAPIDSRLASEILG